MAVKKKTKRATTPRVTNVDLREQVVLLHQEVQAWGGRFMSRNNFKALCAGLDALDQRICEVGRYCEGYRDDVLNALDVNYKDLAKRIDGLCEEKSKPVENTQEPEQRCEMHLSSGDRQLAVLIDNKAVAALNADGKFALIKSEDRLALLDKWASDGCKVRKQDEVPFCGGLYELESGGRLTRVDISCGDIFVFSHLVPMGDCDDENVKRTSCSKTPIVY